MDKELFESLYMSTKQELLDSIDDAKRGELSPHWQEYIRRTVLKAKESGYYPDGADELVRELSDVLARVPQISDTELNRKQVADFGGELLYDYDAEDYGTVMQIIYLPAENHYTVAVLPDPELDDSKIIECAQKMEKALWDWVEASDYSFAADMVPEKAPDTEPRYFTTITDALGFMFSTLRSFTE